MYSLVFWLKQLNVSVWVYFRVIKGLDVLLCYLNISLELKSWAEISADVPVFFSSAHYTKSWKGCRRHGSTPGRRSTDRFPLWVHHTLHEPNSSSSTPLGRVILESRWRTNHLSQRWFLVLLGNFIELNITVSYLDKNLLDPDEGMLMMRGCTSIITAPLICNASW